jgi:glycosyltransferase involved in cell wall biosynthesis
MGQLVADGVPLRLAVIGDGHLRAPLVQRARELGIARRVHFLGFRDDLARLYPDIDVVALTSRNEGTPLTILEAMAAARPVIATAVGGVTDIMGTLERHGPGFTVWAHGVTALSGDVEGYVRGLRFLLADQTLRLAMGARGRKFVEGRMSRERLIDDIGGLYRDAIAQWGTVPTEGVARGWTGFLGSRPAGLRVGGTRQWLTSPTRVMGRASVTAASRQGTDLLSHDEACSE